MLAPADTMGHDFQSNASFELEASRQWLPSWYRSSICVFLGSLRGRSKVLPESSELLFPASNNLHAKEIFWGGKFFFPSYFGHLFVFLPRGVICSFICCLFRGLLIFLKL